MRGIRLSCIYRYKFKKAQHSGCSNIFSHGCLTKCVSKTINHHCITTSLNIAQINTLSFDNRPIECNIISPSGSILEAWSLPVYHGKRCKYYIIVLYYYCTVLYCIVMLYLCILLCTR